MHRNHGQRATQQGKSYPSSLLAFRPFHPGVGKGSKDRPLKSTTKLGRDLRNLYRTLRRLGRRGLWYRRIQSKLSTLRCFSNKEILTKLGLYELQFRMILLECLREPLGRVIFNHVQCQRVVQILVEEAGITSLVLIELKLCRTLF